MKIVNKRMKKRKEWMKKILKIKEFKIKFKVILLKKSYRRRKSTKIMKKYNKLIMNILMNHHIYNQWIQKTNFLIIT